MCTVSVVPSARRMRLICNRDERRTRPEALDPVRRRIGPRTAWFPVDPPSGGTWIGLNDASLAVALLNRTVNADSTSGPRLSRGAIIPPLLASTTLEDLMERAHAIGPANYGPFRLVAAHAGRIVVIVSNGSDLSCQRVVVEGPIMFTSSSLGDDVVAGARRELFARMVLHHPPEAWLDAQRQFHRHQWRSQPAISVHMARPDACTVSRTEVDLSPENIALRYRALRVRH